MSLSKRNQVIFHFFHSLFFSLGCLLFSLAYIQPVSATAEAVSIVKNINLRRPRVGLVLSGGGARGYAHLGVLQALEEMHIPIDYIAATSMGAVVGGLYASGLSVEDLNRILTETNLSDIAFDRNDRAKLPQSQREDDFQYPIGLSTGYGNGKLKMPLGLVQGNNLLLLLQNWTRQLAANISFDQLPTPFRAIATDLGSGEGVVLSQGSLPRAIRASMAVPGLFAPLKLDGKILVDGGLVCNLPVSLAREMGADSIIAVNIATDLTDPSTLNSPAAVAQQMITILIHQNTKKQIDLLKKDDILIEPALENLAFSDFSRGKDGVKIGYDATERQRAKLIPLMLSTQEWKDYLAMRVGGLVLAQDTRIDAIEIKSNGRVPVVVVRRALNVKKSDFYNPVSLNKDMAQLATNGDFKSVTQELVVENCRHVLKINADDKSWGPHFLLLGLGLANNFNGHGNLNLQIGHRLPWIFENGLEWRNDVMLGSKQGSLHTELRQPIWGQLGLYVASYIEYGRRHIAVYSDDEVTSSTLPITAYQVNITNTGNDFGIPIGRLGEFRAGINYQWLIAKPSYNFPAGDQMSAWIFQPFRIRQPVFRIQLIIDQLDDPLFPRKGYYFSGISKLGLSGSVHGYSDSKCRALWAISRSGNTLNFALEAAGSYGNVSNNIRDNSRFRFSLGGFQYLSAHAIGQFNGNYLLYGRLTYLRDMPWLNFPGLRNMLLGTSLEIGDVWQTRNAFGSGSYKTSANIFLGGRGFLGPLYFGLAFAARGVWNIYLQLGRVL